MATISEIVVSCNNPEQNIYTNFNLMERTNFVLETLKWTDAGVTFIDQTKLPTEEIWITCGKYEAVADAIRTMVVRGAPAIGVAAAMGIALGARDLNVTSISEFRNGIGQICRVMGETRPTAVNLFWAIRRMQRKFEEVSGRNIPLIKQALIDEALAIHAEDIATNRAMGANGAPLMPESGGVLTHCNAGALATAGYGTALGVIRAAVEAGKKIHVFADETRPILQGARLTAWELMKDKIPVTLMADNMAATMMAQGKIQAVIVGADRIAANGDTANKIGTYSVAILAHEHGIPMYVAAPFSTIDMETPNGSGIPIEQRSTREVTHIGGKQIAPTGVLVENQAFDVTPARYISAIITERGVATAPFKESIMKLAEKKEVVA
jgi:methylthioribose-1-phosphate isomerase